MNKLKSVIALSVSILFGLNGCVQNGMQIGNSLTLCCPGNYSEYEDYGVQVVDMPNFLRGYVVDEFDLAFQELGLERNDQINDLVVTLSYEHVNLNPEQQNIDPFFRSESITEELRYIAVIDISMKETSTDKMVWSGKISRIHVVAPGEYMHEERARGAFLQTFRDLLAGYPASI